MTDKTTSKTSKSTKVITVEDKYKGLNDIDHILLRPDMYIGSVDTNMVPMWILDEETEKFVKSDILFSPGLYKIFDEIIVNASDHTVRSKDCKNIKVTFDKSTGSISVWNDGPGIEVEFHKEFKAYVPEMIFGNLRTSSTYDEKGKIVGGKNGFGAKLANIFSTEFIIETVDSKNKKYYHQTFTNNMRSKTAPIIKDCNKESYTKFTFTPDYSKFGYKNMTSDIMALFSKRVYDLAICTNKNVNIFLNDEKISCKDFTKYVKMYYENDPKNLTMYESGSRWKICAIYDNSAGFTSMSFVNGICTYNGGTHVKYIADQLSEKLIEIINKKNKDLKVKPDAVKMNMTLFVVCSIEDPSFNSQVKDKLNTKASAFGSVCELSEDFITKFAKTGIIEEVISLTEFKENKELKKSDGKKQKNLKDLIKLDDAEDAGGTNAHNCRLILTEGDSAKAFAKEGLEIIGSKLYGVFPLRGKLLNVRNATVKQLVQNSEFITLKRILGLKQGAEYKSTKELRYGGILILTDQDADGSHIKGLIINMIHYMWPSLIITDNFIQCLRTPLLKIFKNSDKKMDNPKIFYSLNEYTMWKEQESTNLHLWSDAKYYKGLGTSTALEAKETFLDFNDKQVNFVCKLDESDSEDVSTKDVSDSESDSDDDEKSTGSNKSKKSSSSKKSDKDNNGDDDKDEDKEDAKYTKMSAKDKKKLKNVDEYVTLAFEEKRRDDRKRWLAKYDPEDIIEMIGDVTYKDFINKELIHFSNADNLRSIPSIIDSFKPSLRKIFFAGNKRGKRAADIKVAQFAGYIGCETEYHHGEMSLFEAIIGMAQNWPTSNNINLLEPKGNFGSRSMQGKDAASPRYIFTNITKLSHYIYREEDEPILQYIVEEGKSVEPEIYYPIIPMILVNGTSGIGTGYSTNVLQFNPIDIVKQLKNIINDKDYEELIPYYRGFTGTIKKVGDQQFEVNGCYEIISDDTVHITEIPISLRSMSFEKYKEYLTSITILDKKEDNSKKKVIDYIMKPYNNKVDITVQFKAGELQRLIKSNELEKYLKLHSKLSMTNMYLYNSVGKITKYDSPYEILEDFYNCRKAKYDERKKYYIKVLENDANIAKYKRQFIEYILSKKVLIEKQKKDVIIERLKELKFPRLARKVTAEDKEKSYQYLIDMPLWSLTFEKIEELKKEAEDIQRILDDYKDKTIEEIWIQELDEFSKAYNVYIKELDDIRAKEDKLTNNKDKPLKKAKKSKKD
jgi:DNA topoisomerase-2